MLRACIFYELGLVTVVTEVTQVTDLIFFFLGMLVTPVSSVTHVTSVWFLWIGTSYGSYASYASCGPYFFLLRNASYGSYVSYACYERVNSMNWDLLRKLRTSFFLGMLDTPVTLVTHVTDVSFPWILVSYTSYASFGRPPKKERRI